MRVPPSAWEELIRRTHYGLSLAGLTPRPPPPLPSSSCLHCERSIQRLQMQLASSGVRALKGAYAHFSPSGGGLPSRSIHIPAFAAPSQPTTTAQAVFRHSRTAISRFIAHLTAPGTLRAPIHVSPGAAGTRAFHGPATRMPTIQDRLSFPARHILSKPLAVPFLPRAPIVPRHISQVGLGTARNFSTSRPVFQHLAENVPVYARAFSETDWEIRIQQERERLRLEKHKAKRAVKATKKVTAPLRPLKRNIVATLATSTVESEQEELDHYFPLPAAPEVTAYLLIPLAPTPTSRLPLPLNPPTSAHPLLPLDVISSMHTNHGVHALRVSTIFARLDTARVFDEPGVHCKARGDPSGLCTVLEVSFEGWTANRVRGVLGEAGTGWCVLDEVWREQEHAEAEEMDAALEALSVSESESGRAPSLYGLSDVDMNGSWGASTGRIDPAQSFVLPTLDFSASFPAPSWSPPPPVTRAHSVISTPASDLEFHNAWSELGTRPSSPGGFESDYGSDFGSASSDWHNLSSAPSVTDLRFGFSSQFTERMRGSDGPCEEVF